MINLASKIKKFKKNDGKAVTYDIHLNDINMLDNSYEQKDRIEKSAFNSNSTNHDNVKSFHSNTNGD